MSLPEMRDVVSLNNVRIHSPSEQDFILVIHRHYDEQLCLASIEIRPKRILRAHKLIRVTSRSSVPQRRHFLLRLNTLRDDVRRDGHIQYQIALLQLDLSHRPAFQELLASIRVASTLVAIHSRSLLDWRVVSLVWHLRDRRYVHLGHSIVLGVEVCLRTRITALI